MKSPGKLYWIISILTLIVLWCLSPVDIPIPPNLPKED
jgi:hypothetical protein